MTTEVYPFAPKGLPWLRYDIALPAVFMVFLIFPVSSIWNDSVLSAGAKALGYVIVLVFGVSWLVANRWRNLRLWGSSFGNSGSWRGCLWTRA